MEIQQLRYVVAVAEEGTFTAAAQRCFVAQPSLSEAVRKVEHEVGTPLFVRHGRRVGLTAAGEAFVGAARRALRAFDAVSDEVGAVVDIVAGHLDVVSLPSLALDPVARLVGAFCRVHPQVTVRLAHPDGTDDLLRSVRSGASELGVSEVPAVTEGLVVHPFGRQEIVAVLPPGSTRRRMTAAELAVVPLVTQPAGTSTRRLLDLLVAEGGIAAPTIAVETDQRAAVVPLVLEGAGAALLPRASATNAAERGAVVVPFDPPLERDLSIVHRAGVLSPAARAFLALAVPRSQ